MVKLRLTTQEICVTYLTSIKEKFTVPTFTTGAQLGEWLTKEMYPHLVNETKDPSPRLLRKVDRTIKRNWHIDQGGIALGVAVSRNCEPLMEIVFKHYPVHNPEFIANFCQQNSGMHPLEHALLMGSYKVAQQWLNWLGEEGLKQVVDAHASSLNSLLLYQTQGCPEPMLTYESPFADNKREFVPLSLEKIIIKNLSMRKLKELLVLAISVNQLLAERIIKDNMSNGAGNYQADALLSELVFSSSVEPDIQAKIHAIRAKYDKAKLETTIPLDPQSTSVPRRRHL